MTQQFHSWIYIQKNPKTLIQKETSTPVFTAALFTIANVWKQPKCPSTDEWVKKIHTHTCTHTYIYTYVCTHTHTHTLEYYSAIKKNEIFPFAATWSDLEGIMYAQ